ncbi:YdbC family protein [Faecalicatena contorta]|uniref:YdbC family protein n=1 Tax=Faecalicatena contorta TaxID=39482 RepID=UPI0032177F38
MTKFEIIETFAILSERDEAGFQKELNVISWGGRKPKYDIRGWSEDHQKMTKGITLTEDELIKIAQTGLEKLGGK